jgi:phosphoglycolate phosphatase
MRRILFDFDGTIADSEHVATDILNVIAQRHGMHLFQAEEIERLRKLPIRERCRQLGIPMRKLPGLAREFNILFQEAVLKVDPFEGMSRLLNDLNDRGFGISIVSSNAEDNIRRFLTRHDLGFIQDVRCSRRMFSKDKMIRRLVKRQKLRSEDVIYVGDEHRDVVACKKAGVKVIWVRWGFDGLEAVESENPDFMADNPADILEIVTADVEVAL